MTAALTTNGEGAVKPSFARKVVIENVQPEIDCGRFPIKRTDRREHVEVTADIFSDGHDVLYAVLRHRPASRTDWEEIPMRALLNDRLAGQSSRSKTEGRHFYTLASLVRPVSLPGVATS